jgi:hypothetical protein
MPRYRVRLRVRTLVLALPALALTSWGCSSAEKIHLYGGSCTLVTDCAEGLICDLDSGTCSNDLESIQHVEEAGVRADAGHPAVPDGGDAGAGNEASLADAAAAPSLDAPAE